MEEEENAETNNDDRQGDDMNLGNEETKKIDQEKKNEEQIVQEDPGAVGQQLEGISEDHTSNVIEGKQCNEIGLEPVCDIVVLEPLDCGKTHLDSDTNEFTEINGRTELGAETLVQSKVDESVSDPANQSHKEIKEVKEPDYDEIDDSNQNDSVEVDQNNCVRILNEAAQNPCQSAKRGDNDVDDDGYTLVNDSVETEGNNSVTAKSTATELDNIETDNNGNLNDITEPALGFISNAEEITAQQFNWNESNTQNRDNVTEMIMTVKREHVANNAGMEKIADDSNTEMAILDKGQVEKNISDSSSRENVSESHHMKIETKDIPTETDSNVEMDNTLDMESAERSPKDSKEDSLQVQLPDKANRVSADMDALLSDFENKLVIDS